MKTFHFNFNDRCTVTLTKAGAEHLTHRRRAFYDIHPYFREKYKPKDTWAEGEEYSTSFWGLVQDFHGMLEMGCASPFSMGDIKIESSREY